MHGNGDIFSVVEVALRNRCRLQHELNLWHIIGDVIVPHVSDDFLSLLWSHLLCKATVWQLILIRELNRSVNHSNRNVNDCSLWICYKMRNRSIVIEQWSMAGNRCRSNMSIRCGDRWINILEFKNIQMRIISWEMVWALFVNAAVVVASSINERKTNAERWIIEWMEIHWK